MTIDSIELRVALPLVATTMVAILLAPVSWAQDDTVQMPGHIVGEQAYPFDTNDPRVEEGESSTG